LTENIHIEFYNGKTIIIVIILHYDQTGSHGSWG